MWHFLRMARISGQAWACRRIYSSFFSGRRPIIEPKRCTLSRPALRRSRLAPFQSSPADRASRRGKPQGKSEDSTAKQEHDDGDPCATVLMKRFLAGCLRPRTETGPRRDEAWLSIGDLGVPRKGAEQPPNDSYCVPRTERVKQFCGQAARNGLTSISPGAKIGVSASTGQPMPCQLYPTRLAGTSNTQGSENYEYAQERSFHYG